MLPKHYYWTEWQSWTPAMTVSSKLTITDKNLQAAMYKPLYKTTCTLTVT